MALRPQPLGQQKMVGVRYVGDQHLQRDTLLYRPKLEWRRGEVLMVPELDARSYLKHPMIWKPAEAPWDESEYVEPLTDTQLLVELRAANVEVLEQQAPDLARLLKLALGSLSGAGGEPGPGAVTGEVAVPPLHPEDAANLAQFVPGLAQALVQGTSDAVFTKLGMVGDLLQAYPPLLQACIGAEEAGKNRKDVNKRLADLLVARDQGGEESPAPVGGDEPQGQMDLGEGGEDGEPQA